MRAFVIAIFVFAFLVMPTAGGQDGEWKEKLGEDLRQAIEENQKPAIFKIFQSNNDEPINVIVITNDKEELKRHVDVDKELSIISGVSAELSTNEIEAVARLPSTEKVLIDYPVKSFRIESIPLIRANIAGSNYLVNGTNVNISIVDTGINNVSEFQSPNRISAQKCFLNHGRTLCPPDNATESSNATDDNSHGTHVAGIAAGKGGGNFGSGVATNASIFAVKVLNASGDGLSSDIVKGIEWSVDNGANIISLSLGIGSSSFTNCYDVSISLAVENATKLGVLVIVAVGNDGPSSATTAAPACAKSVVSIGMVNDGSNGATPADGIVSESSRGATNDNRTKPDLVAPGKFIDSTFNTSHYLRSSGTSQAAPHVTGTAALFYEKYKSTYGYFPSPHLTKAILLTAVNTSGMQSDGYTQRNNVYGAGRIDANEAIRLMSFTRNSTIVQNQTSVYYINVTNSSAKVTLYWPENSTVSNNLDLIVGNDTLNYTYQTDSRDNVEQVFIYNSTNSIWRVYVNGTTVSGSQDFYLASDREFSDFIIIQSPLNRTYSTGVHFNMTSSKVITNATVSIDNVNHTLTNDTLFHYYNLIIPNLAEGPHNVTFYANDSNRFSANTTFFTVDLTRPLILVQIPENGTYNDTSANLNFTLSEVGNWCGYSLDNSANATLTGCFNSTLTSLTEGLHNITIYANDTVGNMNKSDARLFTVSLPLTFTANGTNATN
ncbi:MAG: S8 family serine peptidase, partial [Candidatus Aenigmatarchaeota archaeon]